MKTTMKGLLPVILFAAAVSSIATAADEPQSAAGEERNKALVRRFYEEVWNKGNYGVASELFTDDYVRHDPRGGNPPPGAKGQGLIAQGFREDCPDCVMSVDLVLADGDYVVGRWTIRGTNKADGKKLDFVGVNIFRFANGKVAEIWNHRDDLAFGLQTGMVTKAPPSPKPQ